MSEPFLDYPQMVRDALRQIPREALHRVATAGLPEPHHFYLSFRTDHPGIGIAAHLRQQYPEEMTVVIQHQFRDLEVDEDGFAVTLYFGGRPERLEVPFAALTAFVDPAVEFGLHFEAEPPAAKPVPAAAGSGEGEEGEGEDTGGVQASVVPIDKFRKK